MEAKEAKDSIVSHSSKSMKKITLFRDDIVRLVVVVVVHRPSLSFSFNFRHYVQLREIG